MRLVFSHKDTTEQEKIFGDDVIIGRLEGAAEVDLDLSFDRWVSHRHARIWLTNGQYCVEDLGSRNGTLINGTEIERKKAHKLERGDVIVIGETVIHINIPVERPKEESSADITLTFDAKKPVYTLTDSSRLDSERRAAILYELPLQFGGELQVDQLLQTIVAKLVEVIPGGGRGSIALCDPDTRGLLLKAHVPAGKPSVSMTLAQRALENRVGFIWRRGGDSTSTQALSSVDCAMYAPLLWKGEALGVVSVDNYRGNCVFQDDDLRLLVAVAQHAAMAVANQKLQEQLRQELAIRSNLLRQFSPKIAERLLGHRGPVRFGGERRVVTILCSDIRGFTKLVKNSEPELVVEMLNDYFSALVPIIIGHSGSIDKYVGDAILCVFGSPEPDPNHYEKALQAAMLMQEKMHQMNSQRRAEGKIIANIGIGVHCGEVVHGFVGALEAMGYTVIGDAVNRTASYCQSADAGEVIISQELFERVWRITEQADAVTRITKDHEHLAGYVVREVKF